MRSMSANQAVPSNRSRPLTSRPSKIAFLVDFSPQRFQIGFFLRHELEPLLVATPNAVHIECKRRGGLPLQPIPSRETRSQRHSVVSSCADPDFSICRTHKAVCNGCETETTPSVPTGLGSGLKSPTNPESGEEPARRCHTRWVSQQREGLQ